jgi:hypothetical protein
MRNRQRNLVIGLVITLLAVWGVSRLDQTDTSAPTSNHATEGASLASKRSGATNPRKKKDRAEQTALLAQLSAANTPREPFPEMTRNPFAAISFDPPPPKIEPPKPTAPPLRFKFLGKLMEGNKVSVFLDNAGGMLIVHPGDTVEGIYRVVSAGEHSIQFEYAPLKTLQTLNY